MTGSHDDFAFEPARGLPAALPEGERLLWQGAPDWRRLAVQAFHVRKVTAYFVLLMAWSALSNAPAGSLAGWPDLSLGVGLAASVAILTMLAFFYARTTVYSLTTRRIVIRSGLALPITLNIPLTLVASAAVRRDAGKAGSVVLEIAKPDRVAYLALWPNARPLSFSQPQPMLRALADVDAVAAPLASALQATAPGAVRQPQRPVVESRPAPLGPAAGVAA